MRVCVRMLIAVVLFVVTVVRAGEFGSRVVQARLESRELGLADIPACGILCMVATVPATGCSLTDLDCTCKNAQLAHTLSACMLANCTMAETHATAKVQAGLCHLSDESKRTELFVYTSVVYFVAIVFVSLRIAGKLISKHLSPDDYIVIAALLFTALPLGCVVAMTKIGFGEHLWNLEEGALLRILRFLLVSSSTYVIVLGLIKISLVLFYLEIFRSPRFRLVAHIVLAYITISTIIIFFMTIFTCRPISTFWNRDQKGQCLNLQALAFANSTSAIIQDLILLILPIVFIRNLQMKRYRKIAVGLMFCVGSFGCIATIIRLQTLLAFKVSIDPTWDYVPVTIWTELELFAGFICVSLPSIRVLVVRMLPARIKELLSQITPLSNRGASAQKQSRQPAQREWKKPMSWLDISQDNEETVHGIATVQQRKSFMSSIWPRNSHVPSSNTRANSQDEPNRSVELLAMPRSPVSASVRESWNTCADRGDPVTSLPAIGCLPEANFSDLDLVRGEEREGEGDAERGHRDSRSDYEGGHHV